MVRLTDRPGMNLDVYRGRKTSMQLKEMFWSMIISKTAEMKLKNMRKQVFFDTRRYMYFEISVFGVTRLSCISIRSSRTVNAQRYSHLNIITSSFYK